jgi:3,4-dihydroxy 2-butanone 4-phosphate synthase/GTP cyclohydrolase II
MHAQYNDALPHRPLTPMTATHLHAVDARDSLAAAATAAASAVSPIADIVAELEAGRMAVLIDEEDRENEGDLIIAADCVTADAINFMAKYGRGLICMPITEARARQLNLAPMTPVNRSVHGTNFTVSIEAAHGVTTGISAADRAQTIRVACARDAKPSDIVHPGHVFPLVAQEGGVLARAGHTEACCDLARLAGHSPAAVLCEILKDDGTMARLPDLVEFARLHGLKIGAIADLIHYRSQNERLIERVGERSIRTVEGEFRLVTYRDKLSDATHLALTRGSIAPERETLVRVHEPLSVLDLLDCGSRTHSWTIAAALAAIARAGCGVLVLLHRSESAAELRQRALTDQPPAEARVDLRNYGIGAQILRDLGVGKMRLLARPRKMPSMTGFGLEVTGHADPDVASGSRPR